jgi:hypothetical protein
MTLRGGEDKGQAGLHVTLIEVKSNFPGALFLISTHG